MKGTIMLLTNTQKRTQVVTRFMTPQTDLQHRLAKSFLLNVRRHWRLAEGENNIKKVFFIWERESDAS